MPTPLLGLMRHTHRKILEFEARMTNEDISSVLKQPSQAGVLEDMSNIVPTIPCSLVDEEREVNLHTACNVAANIHLNSLDRVIPFSSAENQKLVQQLRLLLALPSTGTWHVRYPEIYLWLCLTGTVGTQEGKTWFLTKAGLVIMSLKGDELELFKSAIFRFCQLLQYLDGTLT